MSYDSIRALFQGRWPALILFDLDGTLVDSVPDLTFAVDAMLRRMGRAPAGEENVRKWVGNGATMLLRRALANENGESESTADPQVGDALLQQAVQLFNEEYSHYNGTHARLYDGVVETLQDWRTEGAQLAVVTNKPKGFADPLLELLGIHSYFAMIIGGDCLPERKPHPAPLLYVAEQLHLPVSQTLMVGDSRNDVLAALAAGMRVIARRGGYNYGEPIEASHPDFVFDHYGRSGFV
ncbi:phosphoglycolate phosphatase [gamma proteobacterium HdN1]|nr:phosphoglycolate phosphatase [gamma proteobacterium HdN1]